MWEDRIGDYGEWDRYCRSENLNREYFLTNIRRLSETSSRRGKGRRSGGRLRKIHLLTVFPWKGNNEAPR